MTFWSGEQLDARLSGLMKGYDPNNIDCAAYTLHVGPEVYVTPDHDQPKPSDHTKRILSPGQPFIIPSGQFAFILTEEEVIVPDDAIAFISMKTKIKFKGLINVSGFHADPGYKGRLIFSAFNAGPSPVHLEQGMPLFLMWYADLDSKTAKKKTTPGYNSILPELINGIPGEIYSFRMISDKIKDLETRTIVKVHDLDKRVTRLLTWTLVIYTIVIGAVVYVVQDSLIPYLTGGSANHAVERQDTPKPENEIVPAQTVGPASNSDEHTATEPVKTEGKAEHTIPVDAGNPQSR